MGGGYEDSLKMDPERMGIIPRIVQDVFNIMGDKEQYKYTVHVSYLEVGVDYIVIYTQYVINLLILLVLVLVKREGKK